MKKASLKKYVTVSASHYYRSEKPGLTWNSQEDSSDSSEMMILLYKSFKEPLNSVQPYPTALPKVFWSDQDQNPQR